MTSTTLSPRGALRAGARRAFVAFEGFRARREPDPESPLTSSLLEEDHFQAGLHDLAEKLDRPFPAVLDEATEDLRGMSATHDHNVKAWWDRLGTWMLRGFDLVIDEDSLNDLRALDRKHSLVFLISHKSYLDEWIVPPTLSRFGFDPPFGLAGANLDFFPLGTIARRTGIIHIRRATGGLPIYKFALRSFMGQLVAHRANLIWSIEGGRSRTGKLRPPRFGLLRYVVDAVDHRDTGEVYLVPVSIVYDQLPRHEVNLMTSEARGQGKTPESLGWFVGYLRGLAQRLGRVYLDFGEPLPLRRRLEELRAVDSAGATTVERIAVEVSHRINLATPVTPNAIVCIALLGADRALTLDEIVSTVRPLADYLTARGWSTAGGANLHDRSTLRRALQDLVQSGVLTSFTGSTTVWEIAKHEELTAAIYRNSAIHVLVNRAITEIVLADIADESTWSRGAAWTDAAALRDLLKFDFFFATRRDYAKQLQDELALMEPSSPAVTEPTQQEAQRFLDRASPLVAHLVLRPFIESYWVVASVLADEGDEPISDEDAVIARCLQLGQQWVMQRRIASAESTSGEMFATGLRLAAHRRLLVPDDEVAARDLALRRQDFLAEIDGYRRRIARLAERAR